MDHEDAKARTIEHFANPMPGDRFTEMFAFWVIVLYVTEDGGVMTMEWSGHGAFWNEGKTQFHETLDAFAKAFAYGTIEGYSVLYVDNIADRQSFKDALLVNGQV